MTALSRALQCSRATVYAPLSKDKTDALQGDAHRTAHLNSHVGDHDFGDPVDFYVICGSPNRGLGPNDN